MFAYPEQPSIKVIGKAVRILKLFTAARPEWRLTEIARAVGLPKTVAFDLAESLAAVDLLYKDSRARIYRVGLLPLQLVRAAEHNYGPQQGIADVMTQLRDRTGHSAQLAVLEGQASLAVATVEGTSNVVVISKEGERRPVYVSAAGRSILSRLSVQSREELVPAHPEALTAKTIVDRAELMSVLERASHTGYVVQVDELVDHITAVGVPVVEKDGFPLAGLSLSFLTTNLNDRHIALCIDPLLTAAEAIAAVAADALAQMGDNPRLRRGPGTERRDGEEPKRE